MGFLCADGPTLPTLLERFVFVRRGHSIGTLFFCRQSQRVMPLGFSLALGILLAIPGVARAAGSLAAPAESSLPLPPPPPPTTARSANGEPLPPPPAPKSAQIPSAAAALAQVPMVESAAPPGAPGSDLPPPPPPPQGVRRHDGFYLRMAAGLGISGVRVATDSRSVSDYSFRGAGPAFDLWAGGTPTPGLAMGASLSVLGLDGNRTHIDGQAVSDGITGSSSCLGYFVDVFPAPERGFHFGGALGLAANLIKANGEQKFRGAGLGLEAWGGYDFWVSQQWSLGGMLRLMGSVTREDKAGVSYQASMGGGTLSFTALYH